jgi:multiple sugar transport system substrate-binding protein
LWSGTEEANFKEVLERFTNNTGITVRNVGYSTQELLITVPAQLRAGVAIADVVIAPWPSWILSLAADDHLTSVNDLMDAGKFPPTYVNTVKTGNDVWAIPFKVSGKPGFWYRKSTWQNEGWTIPTTYAGFKSLLATIKTAGVTPIASGVGADGAGWPLSDTTEAWIIGQGGYQLQSDLIFGTKKFNSTEVRNIFVELQSLLEADYFSVYDDFGLQVSKVWDGTYAMYFQGSFITAFEPFKSNINDVGFFPMPETDGATGAVDYAIMPALSKNQVQAKQLMQFLATAEAQQIMVGLGGFLAPNVDVPDSAYAPIDLSVLDFMRTVSIVSDLDDAIGPPFQTTFWDQLKGFWVNAGGTNINDMTQAFQDDWKAPPF